MKKILSLLALSMMIFSLWAIWTHNAYANTTCAPKEGSIKVKVTEKVPWACCHGDSAKWYECHVEKGFGSITTMFGKMIQYATFIAGLGWVLFIVINGIMYSMGWLDIWGWKDEAKKRITRTLIGLIILLLSWVILNAIAPWVYKL